MPRPHHFSSPRAFAAAVRYESVLRTRRARMERGLALAARTGGQVVVGPWLSEIGFELLYWIPMLRRLLRHHDIPPEQVTAISRGGPREWYAGVAGEYVDVLELVEVEEYRRGQRARVGVEGGEKQYAITALDRTVWQRAGRSRTLRVHPLVMYSRLRYYWAGQEGLGTLARLCAYAPIAPAAPPAELALPSRYVAAKPYFSSCFPATLENRRLASDALVRIAEDVDVVLLTTGLGLDDHAEAELAEHPRVHRLGGALTATDNLSVQTRVIAAAKALLATYGGPSYLGVLLRTPSVALASLANHNPRHLEAARVAAAAVGAEPPLLLDAARPDAADRIVAALRRSTSASISSGSGSASSVPHGSQAGSSASP